MANHSATGPEKYITSSEGSITPGNVIAVGVVLPSLGAIAVFARFYGRRGMKAVFLGADDWLILISLILTAGMGIMMVIGSALHGLAQPTPQGYGPKGYIAVTSESLVITQKIFWAFNLVQCLAFGTAKLSVIFFYRRIFSGTIFNIITISMAVIVSIWTVGFFFAILFHCKTNFWAIWSTLEEIMEHCYTSTPMFQAFTISDVITDVLILTIPIYWVSKLHMSLSKRFAVCGIFLLGAVVVGAGIARLVIFIRQTDNVYLNADGIGHFTTEIWWSMIEMGISIVAACLPTIRPLFGKLLPERIIRSVRSLFSLSSRSSLGSGRRGAGASGETLSAKSAKGHSASDDQGSIARRQFSMESGGSKSRDIEAQKNLNTMPAPPNSYTTVTTQDSTATKN